MNRMLPIYTPIIPYAIFLKYLIHSEGGSLSKLGMWRDQKYVPNTDNYPTLALSIIKIINNMVTVYMEV